MLLVGALCYIKIIGDVQLQDEIGGVEGMLEAIMSLENKHLYS
jgi:hypothetical protein